MKELYTAEIEGRAPVLPELPLDYGDFAIWERETCQDHPGLVKRLVFWREFLTGLSNFKLPGDLSENEDQGGGFSADVIDKTLLGKLMAYSKRNNSTLYVTVLTAFSLLLHELSRQDDIVFDIVFSQRPAEIENVMGYFMQIVPIRISHLKSSTTAELLKQVKETSFKIQSNLVPGQRLFDIMTSVKYREDLDTTSVMFNFTSGVLDPLDLPGLEGQHIDVESGTRGGGVEGMFVQFTVRQDFVDFYFMCNGKLYSKEMTTHMTVRFKEILEKMSEGAGDA